MTASLPSDLLDPPDEELNDQLRAAGRLDPDLPEAERLQAALAVFAQDHGLLRLGFARYEDRVAPTGRLAWRAMALTLADHFEVEEGVVLPALRVAAAGGTPEGSDWLGPLQDMQLEGEAVVGLVEDLRRDIAWAEQPDAGVGALLDAVEAHARFEERVLYPLAMAALGRLVPELDPEPVQAPAAAPAGRVLRRTRGRCNTCLQDVPAEVRITDEAAVLVKHCPAHGDSEQLLSRAPDYWEDLDRYYFDVNGEVWPQRDFMVRMTERCNLDCPICLAKANTEDTPDLDLSGLETLLSERRGIKVDLLAAEPTLRADLEDWVRKVKATGNLAALHTNGIKLRDPAYVQRLKAAGVDEVFLQFDGFDDDAHMVLRGARVLRPRLQALENLRQAGIGTSLIVVIARGVNEGQLGEVLRYALRPENTHIKEVFYLGLRVLGSARDALIQQDHSLAEAAMMPDELIDLLAEQVPMVRREDVRRFNKLYFAMLSTFKVRKCLYVQHYMVARDGRGGAVPVSELLDLERLERAAEAYRRRMPAHPHLARAGFLSDLARAGMGRKTYAMMGDLVRLQDLFRAGMNLSRVPERFLLLGFITACDPHNFDSMVALNCGKGELSADGGFVDSGAVANVEREARFDQSDRRPGARRG